MPWSKDLVAWDQASGGRALTGEVPRGDGLRDQSGTSQVLEMPFRCTLRLPGPENPARVCFICIKLGFNEVCKIRLINLLHAINGAFIFPIAVTIVSGAASKGLVISRTLPKTVQPFCAIGLCTSPFADDGPFVGACEKRRGCTRSLDMIARLHSHFCVRKYLVDVSIENDIVDPTGSIHEPVPVCLDVFECVVDDYRCVAVLSADISPAIIVKQFQLVHIDGPIRWLVQELNCCDNIGVPGVTVGNVLDRGQGLGCRVALLPLDGTVFSTVVEPVLG